MEYGSDPMESPYSDISGRMIEINILGEEILKKAVSEYIKNPNSKFSFTSSDEITKTSSEYKKILEWQLRYLLIATVLISLSSSFLHHGTALFNPPNIYYYLQHCAIFISLLLYGGARMLERPWIHNKYMEEQINLVRVIEKYWNFPFYLLALSYVIIVLWVSSQFIV